MLKKAVCCGVLALAMVFLSQQDVRSALWGAARRLTGMVQQSEQPRQEGIVPFDQQLGVKQNELTLGVTLYFRHGQTAVLGQESALLDMRREETVASSIVQRLIDGPGVSHERLNGVFPQGTQLISVTGDGGTAFVTLSRAFLGMPAGAPADWEDSPAWQEEAALRRRLAVQSIVLALTDEARYQRVQVYVAGGDDEEPQRIPMMYMDTTVSDSTPMLAACARDEQVLLTPHAALQMIMDCWRRQDWETLYTLLARTDETPTLSVFEARMREMGMTLLDYEVSMGTVSLDGQSATLVLDAQIHSDEGGDASILRESVPLLLDADNWAMDLDTLLSLMVRD